MNIEEIKCGACRFHAGKVDEYRRYPPQMAVFPNGNQQPIIYGSYECYPSRIKSNDGCGEFKPKGDAVWPWPPKNN